MLLWGVMNVIVLQFDHFRKTFCVNNENESLNDNIVNNMMPVVVNNDMNSCGGGDLSELMLQNVYHDVDALDTVSHVNMTSHDVNDLIWDFHRASDINAYSAPQHGSPTGPMIAHMEADHQPFPRNRCPQVCHVQFTKLTDLIIPLLTISTILTTNSCTYTIILKIVLKTSQGVSISSILWNFTNDYF